MPQMRGGGPRGRLSNRWKPDLLSDRQMAPRPMMGGNDHATNFQFGGPSPSPMNWGGGGGNLGAGLMDSSPVPEGLDSVSTPDMPRPMTNPDDDLLSKLARWIHIGGRR